MLEEFDRRLGELQSPWLAVGTASTFEAGGQDSSGKPLSQDHICEKCQLPHRVTEETRLMEISELLQADGYCDGFLDDLEVLEKARDQPGHFVWLE
jgi:hypothetical protein